MTSRNASSSDSGSTSGVYRPKMSSTSALASAYACVVARKEHRVPGTAPGAASTASPSARRTAGPRRTPPRRRRGARYRRPRPAGRASSGRRRSSTDTKNASMSTCRMTRPTTLIILTAPVGSRSASRQPAIRRRRRRSRRSWYHSWSTSRARLADDPAGHLRLAGAPIPERDRELDDAPAGAHEPVGHLDLEAVAVGPDRLVADPLERLGAVGAVPGRGVVDRQAEQAGGVAVAPAGQQPALLGPVLGDRRRARSGCRWRGRHRARRWPAGRAGPPGRGTGRRRSARTRRRRARAPSPSRPGTPTRGRGVPARSTTTTPPSSSASRWASADVPSVLASSTTITSIASSTLRMARSRASRLSTSSRVGTTATVSTPRP